MIDGNNKKVVFHVEMEITTYLPPELDTDETTEWFARFLAELTVDLPEDTPEKLYFLTRILNAECTEYGKALK